MPVIGTLGVVSGSLLDGSSTKTLVLTHPFARWIGLRSYSLYLWHWPVIVLMRWTVGIDSVLLIAAATILSFALAAGSYRWVEKLFHNWNAFTRAEIWKKICLLVGMVLLCSALSSYILSARQSLSISAVTRNPDTWVGSDEPGKYPESGCTVTTTKIELGSVMVPKCTGRLVVTNQKIFAIRRFAHRAFGPFSRSPCC
jgi:hypothetical protein